ncbi:MAG TPA: type II toxin-antitoxin system prevent-host-death family antitoxin [Acidiferrobacterales bacterium]|nr:type II toxin-antitoxin system prevent-host-death family antitoxin [Acidiferrobacterales bacterium]
MKTFSYAAVRNNLAKAIDQVNEDHAPIIITRQKGASAVLISLEDFESWQETAYLLRSPAMARRLRRAVARIERDKAKPRRLIK